jgi:hypothetical protein
MLASLNAEHLRSREAANNILFDVAPIDSRAASMEDGASWPVLWARYTLIADTAGFLLLRRRPDPLIEPPPRFLSAARVRLGALVTVPTVDCGGVWMQADLRPTTWGRLASLIWKGPIVELEAPDLPRSWRVVPALARAGFMVWPYVNERGQFAELMTTGRVADGSGAASPRVRLVVGNPRPERYFAPHVQIRFYQLGPPGSCGSMIAGGSGARPPGPTVLPVPSPGP